MNGWLPLHVAAIGGHLEVVYLLLAAGARAGAVDATGDKPADVAAGVVRTSKLLFTFSLLH
jgi:ankyrin repeat protein